MEGQVGEIHPGVTQVEQVGLSIFSKSSDSYPFCTQRALLLVTRYEMIFRKRASPYIWSL